MTIINADLAATDITDDEKRAMLEATKSASVAAGLDQYATWPTGATRDGWTFKVKGTPAQAAIVEAMIRNEGIWPKGQTLYRVVAVSG